MQRQGEHFGLASDSYTNPDEYPTLRVMTDLRARYAYLTLETGHKGQFYEAMCGRIR